MGRLRPSVSPVIKEKRKSEKTIIMTKNNAVVEAYKSHTKAETAVKQPQHSGFDIKRLSIPGRDDHTAENVVGYHDGGDRMEYWRKMGTFCGGIWGVVKNSFAQPGTGLKTDKCAVIALGSAEEASRTQAIISRTNPRSVEKRQPSRINPESHPARA